MEIPDIRLNQLKIRELNIPEVPRWMSSDPPMAIPVVPPVTTEVGIPIVNIPGCVEAHKDSSQNTNLKNEDDKGTMTLCDAGTPSYRPIDYDANKLDITQDAPPPPPVAPTAPPEAPKAPAAPPVPKTKPPEVECPTEAQQLTAPVGSLTPDGTGKIIEYRLVGTQCIPVSEPLSISDQIVENIPTAGAITTTATIAVVATTSALLAKPLADLLLRVVKPTVKKVMKKIATLRGKKPPVLSVSERKAEQRDRNRAIKVLRSALKPKG